MTQPQRNSYMSGVIPLGRAIILVIATVAGLAAHLRAQTGVGSTDPHRRAVSISLDAGSYPDAFSTRCGTDKSVGAGLGMGLGAIARPRSGVILEAELRGSWMPDNFGCSDSPGIAPIGQDTYESRPGFRYDVGTPGMPLLRSLVRAGLETPVGLPLIRATVGAGVLWNGHPAPIGSLALGVGTRGRATRFYLEMERDISRARATETRNRYRAEANGDQTPLGSTVVPRVTHPSWTTLHLGVEMPVGRSERP